MESKSEEKEVINTQIVSTKGGIKRPFPNIPENFEKFEINPSQYSEIITESGNIVRIPANSLVDKNGNLIKEKVRIEFKEMRDMVDAFLAGVPMTYDSGGTTQHFESAGMFDIQGYKGDEKIFVKEGEELIVDFASDNRSEKFNLYALNKENGQWSFLEKDGTLDPQLREELTQKSHRELKSIQIQLNEANKKIPNQKPQKIKSNQLNFRVVYDQEEYPELAVYENLQFQILNRSEFKKEYSEVEWNRVDISKSENGNYLVNFIRYDMEKSFECIPVLEGENYEEAIDAFEKNYAESKQIVRELEEEEEKRIAEFEKQLARWEEARKQDSIRWANKAAYLKNRDVLMRRFTVEGFGIYNSDCPRNLPQGKFLAASLKDENEPESDSLLEHNHTYLVEKGNNTLYTYYQLDRFSFNPQEINLLWTITKDNKLAVYRSNKFGKLNKTRNGANVILDMEVIDLKGKTEDEVKDYLKVI